MAAVDRARRGVREQAVGERRGRPRVLFLAPRHPLPPRRGDQLRARHLIRHLAAMADVRVICFGHGPPSLDGVPVRAVGLTGAGRVLANLRHPDPRLPIQARAFLHGAMRRTVSEELESFRPDVLHATLSRMGPYLQAGRWHRHLDLVDSMQLNMRTRADRSRFPAATAFALESRLVGRYESRLVSEVDSASVVGEADRRNPGLERAVVIPNGVDPGDFPYLSPDDRPPVMLFFGNLGYFPNVGAARFLAEHVIARVRRSRADAVLRIAGARPAPAIRRLAARAEIDLVADAPAMAPVLHSAAVAALPMLSGSGMKNKILEAFCSGLPVVTNRLGIEGVVGALPGTHYVLAECESEIAQAVVRLLSDAGERIRLATAARDLVAERYSWRHQAETLFQLYAGSAPSASLQVP